MLVEKMPNLLMLNEEKENLCSKKKDVGVHAQRKRRIYIQEIKKIR